MLQQAAALDPERFPVGEIRLPVINALVAQMKVAVALNTPSEREALMQFLGERLEKRKGRQVAVIELYDAFTDYCQ